MFHFLSFFHQCPVGHMSVIKLWRDRFCPLSRFRLSRSEFEDCAASDRCLACAEGISPTSYPLSSLSFSQKTFSPSTPPPHPLTLPHFFKSSSRRSPLVLQFKLSSQNWTTQNYFHVLASKSCPPS